LPTERIIAMDQFEYVMVLVSIIVGLGIAHILLGISLKIAEVSLS
jgi:hypothetical protein